MDKAKAWVGEAVADVLTERFDTFVGDFITVMPILVVVGYNVYALFSMIHKGFAKFAFACVIFYGMLIIL